MAILKGKPASENLEGGVDDDKIFADQGDDIIYAAQGGNDYIDAEGGDDWISAGPGNDTLYGGSGSDTIYGGSGHDYIDGGRATDTSSILKPYMGSGHGGVVTNDSGNELFGGAGNDYILGGAGNDYIDGGDDEDILIGGFGNDNLIGDNGDDILNGYGYTVNNNSQFDTLTGGAGADTFVLGNSYSGIFYNETGEGYAVIKDFNRQEGDKIQVKGNASQYTLDQTKSFSGVGSSNKDTQIYFIGGGAHELIGVVQDISNTNVSIKKDFKFV